LSLVLIFDIESGSYFVVAPELEPEPEVEIISSVTEESGVQEAAKIKPNSTVQQDKSRSTFSAKAIQIRTKTVRNTYSNALSDKSDPKTGISNSKEHQKKITIP